MKLVIALALLISAASASADQFKTVSKDISSTNYIASISYPQLLNPSVPAYKKINKNVVTNLTESGCDAEYAAESENTQDYYGSARIVALNQLYVGFEVTHSSYCGGAHPNYGTYHLTFDAQTGKEVDMHNEVPAQNFDGDINWDEFGKYQEELAEIIYKNMDLVKMDYSDEGFESDCLSSEDGKTAAIEQIVMLFPTISGLAKDKKVIIGTSPAHVATVCAFSIRVPFSEVKKYFKKDGKVAQWLK